VASGKELGDRTGTVGEEMTASSKAPCLRSPLSPDRSAASHRTAGCPRTGTSGRCLGSGFVRPKHKGKQEADDALPAARRAAVSGRQWLTPTGLLTGFIPVKNRETI